MKRKTVQMILSLTLTAAMCFGAPAAAFAKEAAATEETADQTSENTDEADSEKEKEVENFKIEDLEVKNQSGLTVKSAELQEVKADDSEKKDTDKNSSEKAEPSQNLVITLEDGKEHTFENVTPSDWKDPVFYNEYEIFYISYTDKNGKTQEALENAEETELVGDVVTYAKTNVNIREEADTKSKSLKVTSLGTEFKVTAVRPGWLKVEGDGVKGYAAHTYFTSNKDEIDRLVKEKKAAEEKAAAQAKAAAEAQAAAAAQAAEEQASYSYEEPSYDSSYSEPAAEAPASSEPTEVGRQAYDDCDGSGHGYYEITYSDGSVGYEDY